MRSSFCFLTFLPIDFIDLTELDWLNQFDLAQMQYLLIYRNSGINRKMHRYVALVHRRMGSSFNIEIYKHINIALWCLNISRIIIIIDFHLNSKLSELFQNKGKNHTKQNHMFGVIVIKPFLTWTTRSN